MTVYGEVTYVFHLPQDYDEMKQFEAENDLSIYRRTEDTIAVRYNYKVNATYPYKSKADRKTEPTISKMEQVDKDINVRSKDEPTTQTETQNSNLTFEKDECAKEYEELGLRKLKELRKDEPQTDMAEDIVRSYGFKAESYQQAKAKDEPQPMTDAEITELAKETVHKMIDNSVIAEDAYPDLKQRMHEAVERLDEYYPSEDERSE